MPTSTDGLPDALFISSGSHLATLPLNCTKWGSSGLRDRGALESAVAQPEASFGGEDLYPDLASKAAALGHSSGAFCPKPSLVSGSAFITLVT